jgi:hypothetical protein
VSVQRRRGQLVKVWPSMVSVDNRGNEQRMVDTNTEPIMVTAAFIPQRSAKAEVPGQQAINVTRMLVRHDVVDIDLWARIEWAGRMWDVVTPPSYHHGTRHNRHWSIDIRERPSG